MRQKFFTIVAVVAVCLGVALRIIGLYFDPWLDEIWNWKFVENLNGVGDFFTTIRLDGHAFLYSLIMYFTRALGLGLRSSRVFSVLCSLLSLYVLWAISSKKDKSLGALTLIFASIGFPLIVFASEARGYAAALFFGLCAWWVLEDGYDKKEWKFLLLFWASSVLAFLFQPVFVQFYVGLGLYSVLLYFNKAKLLECTKSLLKLHLIPILAFASTYFFYIRFLQSGGGVMRPYEDVIVSTLSLVVGAVEVSPSNLFMTVCAFLVAIFIFVIILVEIAKLYRKGEDRWILHLGSFLIGPLAFLLIFHPSSIAPRYFIFAIVSTYCVLAEYVLRLYRKDIYSRVFSVLLIVAFGLCTERLDLQFLRYGRGQYRAALQYLISKSQEKTIYVGGDHDFRNEMMVEYFSPSIEAESQHVRYQSRSFEGQTQPEWLFVLSQDPAFKPKELLIIPLDSSYRLKSSFLSAPLSGWSWYLYRKGPKDGVS